MVMSMTYDDCISLVDFLNYRMRKLAPWYTWGVKITWEKLKRWGAQLGWVQPSMEGSS